MDTTASAFALLPTSARSFTHGPTPVSFDRVITTLTPLAANASRTRTDTSHVNSCSVYPALVEVPVVLHGLVWPRPAGTCLLISAGCAALPPLCPGSITTTFPATAAGGAATDDDGGGGAEGGVCPNVCTRLGAAMFAADED